MMIHTNSSTTDDDGERPTASRRLLRTILYLLLLSPWSFVTAPLAVGLLVHLGYAIVSREHPVFHGPHLVQSTCFTIAAIVFACLVLGHLTLAVAQFWRRR